MRHETEWLAATVTTLRDAAPGIREFRLKAETDRLAYATGSHLKVRVLINGRPALRHYSLIGSQPVDGVWKIAVKLDEASRGGSRYMWSLKEGARLEISRPDSQFELSNSPVERLLIAGGIGVTPMLGMAQALRRRGQPFTMIYAGRSRAAMAYLPELSALCGDVLTVAADDDGERPDLRSAVERLSAEGEAYVCGPVGLLEAVRRIWTGAGRPGSRLIYESFGTSGRHPTEAFDVRLPRLGLDIHVPRDKTILEALEEAGVAVLSDCRRGECGLCELRVLQLDGEIDHRDVFFSDEQHREGSSMCACVSRITGGGCVTLDPAWRGDERLRSGAELHPRV